MRNNIKKIARISTVIAYTALQFIYGHESYAQTAADNKDNLDIKSKYESTLEFGIESSVLETIKALQEFSFQGLEEKVFLRMKDTHNEEIISNGFDYFRNIEYSSPEVVNFAIKILEDYDEYGRKTVQYAFFYLGDNTEKLNSEDKEKIQEYILDILNSEVVAISLAALEFIPKFYTEDNSEYVSSEKVDDTVKTESTNDTVSSDENKMPETTDDSLKNNNETSEKNISSKNASLLSADLKEIYNRTSNNVFKSQIIRTLGEIQAYSEVDFIIEVATSDTTVGLRGEALTALAYFEKVPQEIIEKRDALYEKSIEDDSASIRISTIESLGVVLKKTENKSYIEWLKKILRDNDIETRIAGLETIYDLLSEDKINNVEGDFMSVLEYIVQYDPELKVKSTAVKALSELDGGSDFIVKEIDNIDYLYPSAKFYVTSALKNIPDKGGISAVERLATRSIEKKYESNLEFIATEMSKINNDKIGTLVSILIAYPSSSILNACLVTIGKNNLKLFNSQVAGLADDITQPASIRNKAREIVSIQNNKK